MFYREYKKNIDSQIFFMPLPERKMSHELLITWFQDLPQLLLSYYYFLYGHLRPFVPTDTPFHDLQSQFLQCNNCEEQRKVL